MANVSADEQEIDDDSENTATSFMKKLSLIPDHVWRSQMEFEFHGIIGEDFYKRYYLFSRQRNADAEIKVRKFQYLKEGFNKLDVTPKSALKSEAHLLRADIRHAEICLKGTEDRNNFLKSMIIETRMNLENAEKEMNARGESGKVEGENARTEDEDAKKAMEEAKETNAKEDKAVMEGAKESTASGRRTKKHPGGAKEAMEGANESSASRRSTRKRPEGAKEAMEGAKESSASRKSTRKRPGGVEEAMEEAEESSASRRSNRKPPKIRKLSEL